jgi:hypothetical protein
MSPIYDPRFSKTRWEQDLQKEREAGEHAARMEYIKPLVMLLVGGLIVMGLHLVTTPDDPDGVSGPVLAAMYPVVLSIELAFGVAGLWVAATLWLGGAGPLGLGILRLAGIYAMTDLIAIIVAPLLMVGWLITISLYVVMLAWLFDFEVKDSIAVALITFLLKFFVDLVIFSLIMGFG